MKLEEVLPRFLEEPGGHLVMDTDFHILDAGPEYLRLTNGRREALIGNNFLNTLTEPNPKRHQAALIAMRTAMGQVLKTGETIKLVENRLDVVPASGGKAQEKWWRTAFIPVKGDDGEVKYIVMRTEDITAETVALNGVKAQRRSNYILYSAFFIALVVVAFTLTRILHNYQQERINAIVYNCRLENRNHDKTIRTLRDNARQAVTSKGLKATQSLLSSIGIHANLSAVRRFDELSQANDSQTINLINALQPYQNCTSAVARGTGKVTHRSK